MTILSPSLLSADFTVLGEEIEKIDKAGAQYMHLDVMDGMFVPNISYGIPVIKSIRKATTKVFDVHLMINEPIRYIDEFVKAGADIITVHVEACSDVIATLNKIKAHGVKAAITLNPDTPLKAITPYLSMVDMVLVMSVNPGFGGQKFIPGALDKLKELKTLKADNNYNYDIEIDGGVNIDNLPSVIEAGANIVVAGSAVFSGDSVANTKKILEIMSAW